MDVPASVYVIWWTLLIVAVVAVLPLTAGLGIARNTRAVKALDDTVALGGELGAVAGSLRRHSAAIEKTLADRT